ncbi:MAG: hypothetical protein AAGE84_10625 [Cyanobacteria bacterium P01_G01_bin.39]
MPLSFWWDTYKVNRFEAGAGGNPKAIVLNVKFNFLFQAIAKLESLRFSDIAA